MTVIDHNWWMNCKVDGRGVFLRDLKSEKPFEGNVAEDNPDVVDSMFKKGVDDAGGKFPEFIVELSKGQADAPGCSDLAAREE